MKLLLLALALSLVACGSHDSPLSDQGIQAAQGGKSFRSIIAQTKDMFLYCPADVEYSRPTKVFFFSDGHDNFIYSHDNPYVDDDESVLATRDALVEKAIYTRTVRPYSDTVGDLVVALLKLPTITQDENNHAYQYADLALVAFRCKSDRQGADLALSKRYLTFVDNKNIQLVKPFPQSAPDLVVWTAEGKSLVLKMTDEGAPETTDPAQPQDVVLPVLGWGDSLTSNKDAITAVLTTHTAAQENLLAVTTDVRNAMDQKYLESYKNKYDGLQERLAGLQTDLTALRNQANDGQGRSLGPVDRLTEWWLTRKVNAVTNDIAEVQAPEDRRAAKMGQALDLLNP